MFIGSNAFLGVFRPEANLNEQAFQCCCLFQKIRVGYLTTELEVHVKAGRHHHTRRDATAVKILERNGN